MGTAPILGIARAIMSPYHTGSGVLRESSPVSSKELGRNNLMLLPEKGLPPRGKHQDHGVFEIEWRLAFSV